MTAWRECSDWGRAICLADIFTTTAVLDGAPSLDKAGLIGQLLTLLSQAGHVSHADVPAMREAILRREQLGSTGVGGGLAVPHLRHPPVARVLGVLAVCRPPVDFDALDGEPVDIVALVLSPQDRPGLHLGEASRRAGWLFRRLTDEAFCQRLRAAKSAEEVAAILQAEGGRTQLE